MQSTLGQLVALSVALKIPLCYLENETDEVIATYMHILEKQAKETQNG